MVLTHKRFIFPLVALSFFFSSCGLFDHSNENVVITVGNRSFTIDELQKDIKRISSRLGINDQEAVQILNKLIDRVLDEYLIIEYGRAQGITLAKNELETTIKDIKKDYPEKLFEEILLRNYIDFEDWKEELRRQLLINKIVAKAAEGIPPATFEEIKNYFDSHRQEFKHPEMIKFRQVVTKTREEAEKILALLKKGKNFGELEKDYSLTLESKDSSEGGWFIKGMLEESMEDVLFSLPVGKTSPSVKTPYGYHIFEVLDKRPEGFKNLPEAMKEIERILSDQKNESFYKEWLKGLRGRFPVKVNQDVLKRLELG
ncbi:MAG: peptidyl-prolyl cis-trans isomerase [Pseudomonadota bacterium]